MSEMHSEKRRSSKYSGVSRCQCFPHLRKRTGNQVGIGEQDRKKVTEERKTVICSPSHQGLPRNITDASQVKWKVMDSVKTGFTVYRLVALSDDIVVAVGEQDGVNKLKQFNIKEKREIFSEELNSRPRGLTEITLGGKQAIAMSYWLNDKIEFRSLSDLSQIVKIYSTGSLQPTHLCVASPSTLLFVSESKRLSDVYWLDCTGTDPKLTGKKISTELNYSLDICYIPDKKKPLLIATDHSSVRAYDTVSDKLVWNCEVKGGFVTTDGFEYVLVRIDNNIRMLSQSDGQDLGCLIRIGDQGLGRIYDIQWYTKTSLLVIAHKVNNEYHISTIQF